MNTTPHDGAASALFRPEVVLTVQGGDPGAHVALSFGLGGARVASLVLLLATLVLAGVAAGFETVWSRPLMSRADASRPAAERLPAVAATPAAPADAEPDRPRGLSPRLLAEPRRP